MANNSLVGGGGQQNNITLSYNEHNKKYLKGAERPEQSFPQSSKERDSALPPELTSKKVTSPNHFATESNPMAKVAYPQYSHRMESIDKSEQGEVRNRVAEFPEPPSYLYN
jgi:hypothetical protein